MTREMRARILKALRPGPRSPWRPEQRVAHKLGEDPLRIGNVRWGFVQENGRWRARWADVTLDPSGVKAVYLVLEPFPPRIFAAHSVLAFELHEPLRSSQGEEDPMLVLSMEPRRRANQRYTPVHGLAPIYSVVYLLESWGDLVSRACVKEGHCLIRYRLKLSEADQVELLAGALHEAFRVRTHERYHTFGNSCFSAALRLANRVLPDDRQLREWMNVVPSVLPLVLDGKGLLEGEPVMTLPCPTRFPDAKPDPVPGPRPRLELPHR